MKRSGRNSVLPLVLLHIGLLFAFGSVTSDAGTGGEMGKSVYPNPFKEGETPTFQLFVPKLAKVRIDIYDIQGQHVVNLKGGESGELTSPVDNYPVPWDGKDKYGDHVPPGIYICVLVADGLTVKSVKVVKVS